MYLDVPVYFECRALHRHETSRVQPDRPLVETILPLQQSPNNDLDEIDRRFSEIPFPGRIRRSLQTSTHVQGSSRSMHADRCSLKEYHRR